MKQILYLKNALILALIFVLGVLCGYTLLDRLLPFLDDINRDLLLAPSAILFSMVMATIFAIVGWHENNERHRKEITIAALGSPEFTESGLRLLIPFLVDINTKRATLNRKEFGDFMLEKRKRANENNDFDGMTRLLHTLDSYRRMAIGINKRLFHESTAKIVWKLQAYYIFDMAKSYINWRDNSLRVDSEALGMRDKDLYEDLKMLVKKWKREDRDKDIGMDTDKFPKSALISEDDEIIVQFDGIEISMCSSCAHENKCFHLKNTDPHIQVTCTEEREEKSVFWIEEEKWRDQSLNGEQSKTGNIEKQKSAVKSWVQSHKNELKHNWDLAREGNEIFKIYPPERDDSENGENGKLPPALTTTQFSCEIQGFLKWNL